MDVCSDKPVVSMNLGGLEGFDAPETAVEVVAKQGGRKRHNDTVVTTCPGADVAVGRLTCEQLSCGQTVDCDPSAR